MWTMNAFEVTERLLAKREQIVLLNTDEASMAEYRMASRGADLMLMSLVYLALATRTLVKGFGILPLLLF